MDNDQTTATTTANDQSNGHEQRPTATSNGHVAVGWLRLADLCNHHGVALTTGRRWVRSLPSDQVEKRSRDGGGKPEWWVRKDAAAGLAGVGGPTATATAMPTANGHEQQPRATANGHHNGHVAVAPPEESAAGWRAALDAERARTVAAQAQVDHLRAELGTVRAQVDRLQHHVDEAERGRHAAELRLEELRAATWSWVARVRGLAWWRRLRRFPDPPAALVAQGRQLARPVE